MRRYLNLSGESGIFSYHSEDDRIIVRFDDGGEYVYTYSSAGRHHVEAMKLLADSGSGLNSYINKNVKTKYAEKKR